MKKKYFKLIGSILMVLCMIVTVGLTTIGAEAEDMTAASVEYRTDVQYVTDNTEPAKPDDLSNYIFGGWYTNTGTEEEPVYSPVREPVKGEQYVSKWVPAEVLGIQAQVSNNIVEDNTTTQDNNKIRFVTSIDSTAYSKIGFEIKKGNTEAEVVDTTNKVFSKLYYMNAAEASEDNVEEADAGSVFCQGVSQYFKTYTITSIPVDAFNTDITVRPYWETLDGTRVYGAEAIKTVNYGRSWYFVDEGENAVTNSNAPVGTSSNPYTTFASAVAVGTKLNPKFILKSDITLNAQVNVNKTMTIEGLTDAKTIKYSNFEQNKIFNITAGGNLTLNSLCLDGGNYAIFNDGGIAKATDVTIQNTGYHSVETKNGATLTLDDVNITMDGTSYNHDGVRLTHSDNVTLNDVTIKKARRYGVYVYEGGTGGALRLTGTLNIDSPNKRGIVNQGGTVDGESATVTVTSPGEYGVATNSEGKTTIGTLNISNAKGFSAMTVNNANTVVTIYGGKIENSYKNGVNASEGTLNLYQFEIIDSNQSEGSYCDVWAEKNSTINLYDVINADSLTKGYGTYNASNGEQQGVINIQN